MPRIDASKGAIARADGTFEVVVGGYPYHATPDYDVEVWDELQRHLKADTIIVKEEPAPALPSPADQGATVRANRDALLRDSDWTQLSDVPASTRAKWAAYRKALRDITKQENFPDHVVWPVPPL